MTLKYYFTKKLQLDSVVFNGETTPHPENFLKWYENGDIEWSFNVSPSAESPIFTSAFAPQKITFNVDDYLENK